ncbi:MAG TPA: shikimate kinase, partial [Melioribacteraceae bacterium]|nr:shikimate kinase [Melioribacteraceae bacterium]
MPNISRIYLTGFMTSGKSTIGPILANVLGWEFCDLDKVIEQDYKKTIVQIFEQIGEAEFRKVESNYLAKVSEKENIVISLGGGTICNDENLMLIKEKGKLIFLAVSIETLRRRLKKKLDRPLFRDLVLQERPDEEFDERIINL